jgi:hypothetical protein
VEWRNRWSTAIPMNRNRRSVKPSAKPTQVRILHLPPPAETARDLRIPGLAGRCFSRDGVPLRLCESGCFGCCSRCWPGRWAGRARRAPCSGDTRRCPSMAAGVKVSACSTRPGTTGDCSGAGKPATWHLLRRQHGRCPLCWGPLLYASHEPHDEREWEQWHTTIRKAIRKETVTAVMDLGTPGEQAAYHLIHACYRRRTGGRASTA